jgi:hypothetical protein
MWELVQCIVYFFRYKKRPLPLFVVIILIALTFAFSMYEPTKQEVKPQPSPPSADTRDTAVTQATIEYTDHSTAYTPDQDTAHSKNENEPEPLHEQGNVSHFRDSLTDRLKVEGLHESVSEKIFDHMRKQNQELTHGYELSDSVRAAMPDASEEEIGRIRDIVSFQATESIRLFYGKVSD